MSHTRMVVPPFFASNLGPFDYFFHFFFPIILELCNCLGYLHETLFECISGKDHVSHDNYGCFLFLSNCPSIVFLCLFCIIYILVFTITHSEFSQDNVSGTRMNVPPF